MQCCNVSDNLIQNGNAGHSLSCSHQYFQQCQVIAKLSKTRMKTLSFLFRENAPISSRLNAVDLYLVVCIFFVFGKTFSAADVFLIQLKLSIFSCLAGVCRNIAVAEEEAETTDEVGDGDDEEHDGQ